MTNTLWKELTDNDAEQLSGGAGWTNPSGFEFSYLTDTNNNGFEDEAAAFVATFVMKASNYSQVKKNPTQYYFATQMSNGSYEIKYDVEYQNPSQLGPYRLVRL